MLCDDIEGWVGGRLKREGIYVYGMCAVLSCSVASEEYWSELPFPPPGDLPDSGIEPVSPASPALVG